MTATEMLPHALGYAALGWRVLPVWWVDGDLCGCGNSGCASPGKHPLIPRWQDAATTDHATISSWWAVWPHASIAIATGWQSGIVVIDFDGPCAAGVPAEVAALREASTPRQRTGRADGLHVLIAVKEPGVQNRTGIWPGVDVRGDGGYVVVAPSLHASGRRYVWETPPDTDMLRPSDAIEAMLYSSAGPVTGPGAASSSLPEFTLPLADTERARIESALAVIDPDLGYESWVRVGMALHSTCAGVAAFELWNAWSATGSKYRSRHDLWKHWRTFRSRHPNGATLGTLYHEAQQVGWTDPIPSSSPAGRPARPAPASYSDVLDISTAEAPWLIEDVLAEGDITVIAGASQSFKTFFAIDLAVHVAWGIPRWRGLDVVAGTVLFLPGEGQRGLGRRMSAWRAGHPDVEPVPRRLFVAHQLPTISTKLGQAELWSNLTELAGRDSTPRLIIIDTLACALGGADENDAAAIGEVIAYLNRVRAEFSCAVVLLHHPRKGLVGPMTLDSLRGSGALAAGVEWAISCTRAGDCMTAEILKAKDGEIGRKWASRFEVVRLGTRANGKPITSGYLQPIEAAEAAAADESELRKWLSWFRTQAARWPQGASKRDLAAERPSWAGRNVVRRLIDAALDRGLLALRRGLDRADLITLTPAGEAFSVDISALLDQGEIAE